MRYVFKSDAGSLFAMKLRNNGKLDIRENLYSGLFVWTKDVCGMDFIRKLRNGQIGVHLSDSTDVYRMGDVYIRDSGKYTSVGLEFETTQLVDKDTPWKFKNGVATKNMGSDDVQITLTGKNIYFCRDK